MKVRHGIVSDIAHKVLPSLVGLFFISAFVLMVVSIILPQWIEWNTAPLAGAGLFFSGADNSSIRWGLFDREVKTERGGDRIFVRTSLGAIDPWEQAGIRDYQSTSRKTAVLCITSVALMLLSFVTFALTMLFKTKSRIVHTSLLSLFLLSCAAILASTSIIYYHVDRPRDSTGQWDNYSLAPCSKMWITATSLLWAALVTEVAMSILIRYIRKHNAAKQAPVDPLNPRSFMTRSGHIDPRRMQFPSESALTTSS